VKNLWQRELAESRMTQKNLLAHCSLPVSDSSADELSEPAFAVKLPKSFLERIRPENPLDPLLLQVLPDSEERQEIEGFSQDPVGDRQAEIGEGLVKKYRGRVLVLVNGTCAIHCRFCFRQNFPYDSVASHAKQIDMLRKLCAEDPSVSEVILSGGDPLTAPDEILGAWIAAVNDIPAIRVVRIHSRVPIVMPSRISTSFLERFSGLKAQKIIVFHINHAQEINHEVANVIADMKQSGFVCLSQSVLLRGINDNLEALETLFESLCRLGVMPYYLHQLDRVSGAQRFFVEESDGIELIRQLRARLPGYAVPRYVKEVAGESSKTVIA
jgi:EF-P beta-lysylation protein EpmB